MRWTWDYLGATRTLHDDANPLPMPGAGCVNIQVVREKDTGMPPNENELEDRVQQLSGRVWLFNYLDSRRIELTLSLFGKQAHEVGSEDIILAKRVLAQWFNPQPTAPDGALTFYDTHGVVRAINARYDSGLEGDWLYIEQGEYVSDVRLLCADPLWYDPELQEVTWSASGKNLTLCYELPYALCVGIGASTLLTNAGDWATYPIITVAGPATDVVVQNVTTGETVGATYSIPAGKSVTYDFSPGVKTVTDSDGNSLMGTLVQPNDLATFHLACAFEYNDAGSQVAPNGDNVIVVTTDEEDLTTVTTSWYNRYLTN